MSTLQELIRYCNEDQHLGALLLTGEWGSGKTYLIEKELADALRDTHFIVRVSLFGVDSIESMRDAVRRQWLLTCTPLLGKLQKGRDGLDKSNRFLNAFNSILRIFNPVAGNVASAIITVDPLEYIPLEPEVDDYLSSGRRKEVVLVFDDLIHSKLDWADVVGNINEYCENLGFKTILIANEEVINASTKLGDAVYKRMKEKTIGLSGDHPRHHCQQQMAESGVRGLFARKRADDHRHLRFGSAGTEGEHRKIPQHPQPDPRRAGVPPGL